MHASAQMMWCTSAKLDASGAAVGRRYARMDELGVPFGVTVDFQTVEDHTVTLRERDSMSQIRMPVVEVASLVARLVKEEIGWKVSDGFSKYRGWRPQYQLEAYIPSIK